MGSELGKEIDHLHVLMEHGGKEHAITMLMKVKEVDDGERKRQRGKLMIRRPQL